MLEKRKEESDGVGKYQNMLVSAMVAGIIVFLAPTLVVVVTDACAGKTGLEGEACLWDAPDLLPDAVSDRVEDLIGLMVFIVRIVIVFSIILAVILLRVEKNPYHV